MGEKFLPPNVPFQMNYKQFLNGIMFFGPAVYIVSDFIVAKSASKGGKLHQVVRAGERRP